MSLDIPNSEGNFTAETSIAHRSQRGVQFPITEKYVLNCANPGSPKLWPCPLRLHVVPFLRRGLLVETFIVDAKK